MKFLHLALLFASAAFTLAADIPETAIAAGSFGTLVAALTAADLVDTLSAPNGPYTVFAPTDDAFGALPAGLVECLLLEENKEALTAILTYHVLGGEVLSTDLTDGMMAATLQGENVTVDLTDGVKISDAVVSAPNVETDNGVIHVIDSVLVPPSIDVSAFFDTCPSMAPSMTPSSAPSTAPSKSLPDIPQTAIAAGSFGTLVAALTAADLVDTLSAPNGPYTVFAPTDDAFGALPAGLVECLLLEENKEALTAILTYHVLDVEVLSTDLTDGMMAATLQGENVSVDLTDGVKISDAVVSAPDVETSNGVIHIIDSVLVPPSIDVGAFFDTCPSMAPSTAPSKYLPDIPETAIAAGSFGTLVAALTAADLVDTLSAPNGPYTVFAPTDDAFGALPAGLVECLLLEENKEALTAILTYHVLDVEVLSTDLTDGMMAATLQGENVTVDLTDGVKISDAVVSAPDVETSNGVIHIIDSVLVPPSIDVGAFFDTCPSMAPSTAPSKFLPDIPETAIAAGSFGTLVAALTAADLVDTLSAPNGPYTVFAPTDDAFGALPAGLVECLLLEENKEALTAILTYHVLGGEVLSTDLTDGMMAATLQGENVTVDLTDGVKISDAVVSAPDVETSNGVIHIIDSVLVPPSIDVSAFFDTCPSMAPSMTPSSAPSTAPSKSLPDIPQTAIAAGSFGTLVAALTAADLVDTLSAPNGPYTVFAPTDDAFGALPAGLVECLLLEENKEALTAILTYHVLDVEVLSTDLTDGMMAATLQGENVTVDLTDGVKISDAVVSAPDVETSNGVIHIIDSVLVPPSIDVGAFFDTCPSMAPSMASSMPPTMTPSAAPTMTPSIAPSSNAVETNKIAISVFTVFAGLLMM